MKTEAKFLRLSTSYRVSIPKRLRHELGLQAGDSLVLCRQGSVLVLKRVESPYDLIGTLPGPNTFVREKKDREF